MSSLQLLLGERKEYHAQDGVWESPYNPHTFVPHYPGGEGGGGPMESTQQYPVPADGKSVPCPLKTLAVVSLLGDLKYLWPFSDWAHLSKCASSDLVEHSSHGRDTMSITSAQCTEKSLVLWH